MKKHSPSSQQQQVLLPQQQQQQRLRLFDHLTRQNLASSNLGAIHPATIKVANMFQEGAIREDDDRFAALIEVLVSVVKSYSSPPDKVLSRDLEKHILDQATYISQYRPMSMGMANLLKELRRVVTHLPPDLSEADSKSAVLEFLRIFLEEKVVYARERVVSLCEEMIKDNDVVLTFGTSAILRQLLLVSARSSRSFRLIVVDSRPLCDGLKTIQLLSPHISCVYTPLSGISAMIKEVTKVFLSASALLSNGSALAPAGTALVAAVARHYSVPVVVVAESYKCCEKVQLDSIVYNEMGSPDEIIDESGGPTAEPSYSGTDVGEKRGQQSPPVQVVNLRYDLTPLANISVVATELGLIPPTSVPVLIRELATDQK